MLFGDKTKSFAHECAKIVQKAPAGGHFPLPGAYFCVLSGLTQSFLYPVELREKFLYPRHDTVLLGERREGKRNLFNNIFPNSLLAYYPIESTNTLLDKVIRLEKV